jgi:hypothetical protein
MKRCKECNKLADNGNKFCQYCGTAFEYDPKVTPFSERRIILGILIIVLVGVIVYKSIPLQYPDPTECSKTSYNRYKRIAENYYKETKNILREELLFTSELSELRSYKNDVESIPVPACLEPAKEDLVNYMNQVYYIGVYSMWGAYQGAAYKTENAGYYWEAFNAHLAEVKECLPDCP